MKWIYSRNENEGSIDKGWANPPSPNPRDALQPHRRPPANPNPFPH